MVCCASQHRAGWPILRPDNARLARGHKRRCLIVRCCIIVRRGSIVKHPGHHAGRKALRLVIRGARRVATPITSIPHPVVHAMGCRLHGAVYMAAGRREIRSRTRGAPPLAAPHRLRAKHAECAPSLRTSPPAKDLRPPSARVVAGSCSAIQPLGCWPQPCMM